MRKNSLVKKRMKRVCAFALAATLVFPFSGLGDGNIKFKSVYAEDMQAGATTTATQATTTTTQASTTTTTQAGAATTTQASTTTTTQVSATTTQAPNGKPAPVKALNVSDQTMTTITVSWEAVEGVTGYILQTYNYTTSKWDPVDTILAETGKTNYSYVVDDMNAGTTHRFRISTYSGDVNNASDVVKSIKTGCKPGIAEVEVVKGNKCARINWNAIKCSGYKLYMKKDSGEYELIATLSGSSNNTFLKKSLSNGSNYTFKVCAYSTFSATDNGVSYSNTLEGDSSNEENCTPGSVSKTSSSAYLYSSQAKFKASAAYKTYALAKKINYNKSFVIPGLAVTNVNGINSKNFVPQGTVCAGSYYLMGAYDKTGVENSVIYVMKRSTYKYVMTLVLPNKEKVTDMAYDGTNVWMTAGNSIACVRYKTITSKISTGAETATLSYMNTYNTVSNPALLSYYDGKLWVGTYNTSAATYMSGYSIGNKTSKKPTLTYANRMQVPAKTKAVTIDSDGRLYLIRANQVKKGLSGYISEVRAYKPTWTSATSNGTIKKNTATKVCKLPAMSSGITIYNTYTYINFESAKESECKYPTDRSWAVKTTSLQ